MNSPSSSTVIASMERLASVPTTHLSDNLGRMNGIVGLHAFHGTRKLVGTALTVKVRPGDNLLICRALMLARQGDVLVVDSGGGANNAVVGEMVMLYAQQRGCVGFVVDGAVRDIAAFRASEFPCWGRAVSHRGPFKNGPGEIGAPVAIGGQVVSPGDVVVADEDGIVTFPAAQLDALLGKAAVTAANEQAVREEIANGRVEQSWLTRVLAPHGLLDVHLATMGGSPSATGGAV